MSSEGEGRPDQLSSIAEIAGLEQILSGDQDSPEAKSTALHMDQES